MKIKKNIVSIKVFALCTDGTENGFMFGFMSIDNIA